MSKETLAVIRFAGWFVMAFIALLLIVAAIAFVVGLLLPSLAQYRGAS